MEDEVTALVCGIRRGDGSEIASTITTQPNARDLSIWIDECVADDISDLGLSLDDLVWHEATDTDEREGYWTRDTDEPIAIVRTTWTQLPAVGTHPAAARMLEDAR